MASEAARRVARCEETIERKRRQMRDEDMMREMDGWWYRCHARMDGEEDANAEA